MADSENPAPDSAEGAGSSGLPASEAALLRRAGSRSRRRRIVLLLLLCALALSSIKGMSFWREHYQNFETTENAYVQTTVVPVSPQVDGVVREMLVSDNQAVHAGDLLVRLG